MTRNRFLRAVRRVAARFATQPEWAVDDQAWHGDQLVTVTKVWSMQRMVRVQTHGGITYPVMVSDLRRGRHEGARG